MSFARYRVLELAGRGGMGVVYRAVDTRLDRVVALKVIAPAWASDDQFRTRFFREARSVAAIEHPNIIPVYDADEHQGRLYLAMRYVGGGDLLTLVRTVGALDVARAQALALQLAGALDAAHRGGVVHRDVKPANALLSDDVDAAEHVYLADFGVASSAAATTLLTAAGGLVGSLAYMAPEVIEGEPASPASDLYSLACLLYELVCGQPPFVADTQAALMMAHVAREPAPPSALAPGLSPVVDEALRWGLAKQPSDRPPSCLALVQAAGDGAGRSRRARSTAGSATVTQAPLGARTPEDATQQMTRPRTHTATAGAVVVLACVVAGGAVGTSLAPGEPRPSQLTLRSAVASAVLPGWRSVAPPAADVRTLMPSTVRSARGPAGVTATVGTLRPSAERPVLEGGAPPNHGQSLRLTTVTVRETARRDGAGEEIVAEARATTNATLAVICRGATRSATVRECRSVAARVDLLGADDLPANAAREFALAVRAALTRADGARAERALLGGPDAVTRRDVAARLAAEGRSAATDLDGVAGATRERRFASRLAAALRARSRALDSVAAAYGLTAELSAARGLRSAQRRVSSVVDGGRR